MLDRLDDYFEKGRERKPAPADDDPDDDPFDDDPFADYQYDAERVETAPVELEPFEDDPFDDPIEEPIEERGVTRGDGWQVVDSPGDSRIVLESFGDAKIATIKVVRNVLGLGLREAKLLVESAPVEIVRGVSPESAHAIVRDLKTAGARARVESDDSGSGARNSPAQSTGRQEVLLESYGRNKIAAIKVVRSATGLGLRETKNLVESAPVVIGRFSPMDAARLVDDLVACGADARSAPGRSVDAPSATDPDAGGTRSVVLESFGNAKLGTVKVIRSALGVSLLEAKRLAESAPVVLADDLSPAAARTMVRELEVVGARARVDADSRGSVPTTTGGHDVLLESFGRSKIAAIKAVREATGLGLRDTKNLVESAPVVIHRLTPTTAARLVDDLVACGADARLVPEDFVP